MSTANLNVLYMPAVDWDLSNYFHYVAPDSQHNRTNWKHTDGAQVKVNEPLFSLEYDDVASFSDGYLGWLMQQIGFSEKPSNGEFVLYSPAEGTIHIDSGFYADLEYIENFEAQELSKPGSSLSGVRYAFHMFTEHKSPIFPYNFYKPWFDFVDRNRNWIEHSIRHWDEDGLTRWHQLMRAQKSRLQNIPCQVITYGRFVELQRALWGDNPNRPNWLK